MHASAEVTKPAALPVCASVQDLVKLSVSARLSTKKFTLNDRGGRAFSLHEAGLSMWSRRSGIRIELTEALGREVRKVWKVNKYNTLVGSKSLATIVKQMGGPDLRPAIRAAEREVKAAEERTRALNTVRWWSGKARDFLQVQGPAAMRTAQFDPAVVARVAAAQVAVEEALNAVTRSDAVLAEMSAYDNFGNAIKND